MSEKNRQWIPIAADAAEAETSRKGYCKFVSVKVVDGK